jgi:hypothetical protein
MASITVLHGHREAAHRHLQCGSRAPKWRGAELRGGGHAERETVAESGTHIVEQEVGVEIDGLVLKRFALDRSLLENHRHDNL